MFRIVLAACLVFFANRADALILGIGGVTPPNGAEEFVGPFANWLNVKSGCSGGPAAVGDGTTNDTTAFQDCFNALSSSTPSLWVPAGNYKWQDVSTTATASLGASSITVASAAGIVAGMLVAGTGIPGGDTVAGTYTPGSTTVPLLVATTGSLSATAVSFSPALPHAALYLNVIGADPSTTTILWGGSSGGTMLYLNGVGYSRIDRLTFNGNSAAANIIDQSWDNTGAVFDTGNEYADDVFENAGIALRCGNLGYGCAETTMLRDQFLSNTTAGVSMRNSNALDMWVRYSFFNNNAIGLTNNPGVGNFHAFSNLFENSTTADIDIGNLGIMSFNWNYSVGSNQFIGPCVGISGGSLTNVRGNTILDTTNSISICVGNAGPLIATDNIVRSLGTVTTGPIFYSASFIPTDGFSLGNTFTAGPAGCGATDSFYATGHCHSTNDQVVSRSAPIVNPPLPTLPPTPPNKGRTIYEASTLGQITAGITSAAVTCDNSVVHIQAGSYSVSSTIVVPASCPIQIIGDGGNSHLTWSGGASGVVMQLTGPSKVVLRDLLISGNSGGASGIVVTNADQGGAHVFLEEPNLTNATTNNLLVDSLNNTNVQLQDAGISGSSGNGVNVIGGSSIAGGVTNIFAGAGYNNNPTFTMSNNANLYVGQFWNDSGSALPIANLSSTGGAFTIEGLNGSVSPSGSYISFNNFTGASALVGTFLGSAFNDYGTINITGTGTGANNLVLGGLFQHITPFVDTSGDTNGFLNGQNTVLATANASASCSPCSNVITVSSVAGTIANGDTITDGGAGFVTSGSTTVTNVAGSTITLSANTLTAGSNVAVAFQTAGVGSTQMAESGSSTSGFLTTALAQLRSQVPYVPAALPAGVTDLRLYRVYVDAAIDGVDLEH